MSVECVGATPNLDVRRATFQAALDAMLAEPQPDLRNVALVRSLTAVMLYFRVRSRAAMDTSDDRRQALSMVSTLLRNTMR